MPIKVKFMEEVGDGTYLPNTLERGTEEHESFLTIPCGWYIVISASTNKDISGSQLGPGVGVWVVDLATSHENNSIKLVLSYMFLNSS